MAEAIGLGASLLGIAAAGAKVVTTLRVFLTSYTSADQKTSDLSTDVSLTASILTELATTVQEYEVEFRLKVDNFNKAKEICERNFNLLRKAIKEAKKSINREETGTNSSNNRKDSMSAWEKLKFALGGEANFKELAASAETSKSNLQLLLDSVNLLILKKLSKKNLLNEDQSEDLKLLVLHLPFLIKELHQAGLVQVFSKSNPNKVAFGGAATVPEKVPISTSENEPIASSSNKALLPQRLATASKRDPAAPIETQKDNETKMTKVHSQSRDQSQTFENMIGDREKASELERVETKASQKVKERHTVPEAIYESWLYTHRLNVLPTTYHLCGLCVTTYRPFHDLGRSPILHSFVPLSIDQAKLQKEVASFISKGLKTPDPGRASKLLFGMPSPIHNSVHSFVINRTTHPKYEWTLAAFIDQTPKASMFSRRQKVTKITQLALILRSAPRPLSENGLHNLKITYDPWLQIHHQPLTEPYGFPSELPFGVPPEPPSGWARGRGGRKGEPLEPLQAGVNRNPLNRKAPRKYETDLGSGSSDSSKELVSITDDEQSVHRSGSPSVHESSRRGRRLGSSSSTSSEIYHADQHIPKRSKAKRRGSKAERAPDGHKEIRTDTENNSSQGSENVDMEEEEKDLVEQEEAERIMDEFLATFTETGEQ